MKCGAVKRVRGGETCRNLVGGGGKGRRKKGSLGYDEAMTHTWCKSMSAHPVRGEREITMVHERCKFGKWEKGRVTTAFYIDGKPQIYCYGIYDAMTDEPLKECKSCKEFLYGEQIEKDWEAELKRREAEE